MTEEAGFAFYHDARRRRTLPAPIPLKRLGRPEEVATAALFLACDDGSYIAGSELCIDGGIRQV